MNLQLKLTIPVVIGFSLYAAAVHFFWAPHQYAQAEEQAIKQLSRHFLAMDTGLIRNLLENDYAALHATLDEQLRLHGPEWHYLTLHDSNGRRLYPLMELDHEEHEHNFYFPFTHAIKLDDSELGKIRLHVDWAEQFNHEAKQIQKLEIYLLATVLFIVVFILYWQRRIILTPIFNLQDATEKLSEGDYGYPLPKSGKDELGQLIRGFSSMRSRVLWASKELEKSHLEIQQALNEVTLKNRELKDEIEHRKRVEARLSEMAMHDELTGLPNRYLLRQEAVKCLALGKRNEHKVGIMFVDLDAFKLINDNHGHEAGDRVLVELSRRITKEVRQADTVGRVGGDEFIIVLPDCGSFNDLSEIAKRILHQIAQPIESIETLHSIGASIGISIFPDDGDAIDQLINKADATMYEVKKEHRSYTA